MERRILYVVIFLLLGAKVLESQTIKKTIPLNQRSNGYIHNNKTMVNEPGSSPTPSFIKYNLKIVKLPGAPDDICIPPGSDKAFCTIPYKKALVIISLSSGNITDTIKFTYPPEKMVMSADGKMIYIISNNWTATTVGPGCVYAVNTSDNKVTEMFPYATPQIPYVEIGPFDDIMLDEKESLMYLVDAKWIYVMDVKQNLLVDVFSKPDACGYLNTFAFHNQRIFGLGEVTGYPFFMINLLTREIKYLTAGGKYNFSIQSIPIASPDGNKVFVTVFDDNYNAAGMDVFNSETGDFELFIPNLTTLGGFIYNKDSTLAYLNLGEFTVTSSQIFNMSTLSKVGEISGGGSSGVRSKDNRFLFFTKYGANKRTGKGFSTSFKLDLTVVDLNRNYCFSINTTDESTDQGEYRSIALSDDSIYIAITNPQFNSVSIISNIKETIPEAVSLITPIDSSINNSPQITLKWESIPDVSNYQIQVSSSESFSEILVQDSLITQTSYLLNSLQSQEQYYWRARAKNIIGWGDWSATGTFTTSSVSGINNSNSIPKEYSIKQNYPNPFNPTTTISYSIPKRSYVKLNIYDVLGKEVACLVNEEKEVGNYNVEFNGSDLSSGVYFYKLTAGEFVSAKKLVLTK